ncbi:MAG: cytochrome c oxidase assembly protein [Betaproteobacteria bacterium]|nr:cytochrome c oxidase assembly protein [Betaproteobacteria bacterium]
MSLERQNRRTFLRFALIAAGMFGFGYALVPFYYQICAAWDVRNIESRAERPANTQVDLGRTVTVELDSNTHKLPWSFRPLVKHVAVHPGEVATVEYEVTNTRGVPITGQAIASYGPQLAGEYFRKFECFCFTQQTLQPGETRRLPVVFVIDPKLPRDVNSIALSYTFFEVEGRSAAAAGDRS